ncbi:hypothetical protein [Pseudarthrobacter sp. Y6]|uniref:hypothetical protein n=1 Tax=Pseudarthrobacter sp. Y6 TaxID=3418422 RepID=UPI003CEF5D95
MTSHDQAAQRAPRKRPSQRQKDIWRRAPIIFSIVVLVCFGTWGIQIHMDRPRLEADVVSTIEVRGGEVIKIVHRPGRATPGYVDVVFDGQQSRCTLHLLDQDPPVFDCDPAVDQ